jgi:hypothetical protein
MRIQTKMPIIYDQSGHGGSKTKRSSREFVNQELPSTFYGIRERCSITDDCWSTSTSEVSKNRYYGFAIRRSQNNWGFK